MNFELAQACAPMLECPVDKANVVFDDADSYERYMGRWSRVIGTCFLDWIAPPADAAWLDVGCGTGVFTKLVLDACSPAKIVAIDPAQAQIAYALTQPMARSVEFKVSAAYPLPFAARSFDVVASALVLNFVQDRSRALSEMSRVCRPGGLVGAYVWDFASDRSMAWPLVRAMKNAGVECPPFPGESDSSPERFGELFEASGFREIEIRSIEVTMTFANLEEFWRSQTPRFSTHGKIIADQPGSARNQIYDQLRGILSVNSDDTVEVSARASAVKAQTPHNG
jgi:ubiquinone/menaquinone biosynthesis C-methylase UbiE